MPKDTGYPSNLFRIKFGYCDNLSYIAPENIAAMETLFKKHRALVSQVGTDIIRDAMNTIKWEKRLVAIRGSRGVGKTTLMRQYIKMTYGVQAGAALYCVMDSMYFTEHSLLELAEQFHLYGGEHLFLDEVHKYPTWTCIQK